MIKILKENEFKSEIKDGIVVVDFYADWCAPCKMLAPIFEELASEMKETVKFVKVNVDNSTSIANEYNITSIPALVIFKNGEMKEISVGFRPKENIKVQIESYLQK
ncbi:thioredoxin [Clostridium sp. MF28]|uniref:thioredoxin n=1 Tax=Clostridium TaxID=1485 RepID=UPI000CFA2D4A|nr:MULTISPECIES: thioredoxin [Clostridium]AVK49364.1 thioredoxin [Clostridium sp. MF28]PSM58021.1 thioredoxin [Clostridium diolis]